VELDKQPLTEDDVECLWAIARRGAMQERLVLYRGYDLEKRGLISITHGLPTLTVEGRRQLDRLCEKALFGTVRKSA
jgi:hypothetical protein